MRVINRIPLSEERVFLSPWLPIAEVVADEWRDEGDIRVVKEVVPESNNRVIVDFEDETIECFEVFQPAKYLLVAIVWRSDKKEFICTIKKVGTKEILYLNSPLALPLGSVLLSTFCDRGFIVCDLGDRNTQIKVVASRHDASGWLEEYPSALKKRGLKEAVSGRFLPVKK